MNIHILTELSKDMKFRQKHGLASIIFCDGVPLVWLSRLCGMALPERVSGTDLVKTLLTSNYRVFLLGSSNDVLKVMKKKYKNTCGTYSPSYATVWGAEENKKIIKRINKYQTDILLVGVGPLKQERWIIDNKDNVNSQIMVGVGSAFDILSGKTPRAPRILRNIGLEWAWRLVLEPNRLARRYGKGFLFLIKMAFFSFVRLFRTAKI